MRPASGSGTFSEESTELLTWNQAELLRNCWLVIKNVPQTQLWP